jgi:hypothetical protein
MTKAPRVQWGQWKYRADVFSLDNETQGYEVDLDTCTDSAQILNWVFQASSKEWSNEASVDLIEAFRDIFNRQANVCPGGKGKKIDPRAVAQSRGYSVPARKSGGEAN